MKALGSTSHRVIRPARRSLPDGDGRQFRSESSPGGADEWTAATCGGLPLLMSARPTEYCSVVGAEGSPVTGQRALHAQPAHGGLQVPLDGLLTEVV